MKFHSQIEIDLCIEEVVILFGDAENTKIWLKGLRSYRLLSGTLGEPGAECKVIFDSAIGPLELTETIVKKNLPEEYVIMYRGKGYKSMSTNRFEELDNGRTAYFASQEVNLHGLLGLAGPLVRGAMVKQFENSLVWFKQFAEAQKT